MYEYLYDLLIYLLLNIKIYNCSVGVCSSLMGLIHQDQQSKTADSVNVTSLWMSGSPK